MAAHQAPLSLGFSRQEYWSGLSFPSPVHESEKSKSLSRVRLFTTPRTIACQAPLSMGILQTRMLEWVAMPSSRESSNPGMESRSPALQVVSLLSEPPGKPKKKGVSSLFLLPGIYLAQESNWSLLHCRWIFTSWAIGETPEKYKLHWTRIYLKISCF